MRMLTRLLPALFQAFIVLSVLGLSPLVAFSQTHQFVHPGITWSINDLNQLSLRATTSPWSDGWNQILNSAQGSLNYQMRGPFVEVANRGINQSAHTSDAQAALYHAFQWHFTGNEAHAILATEIVDSWATTHTIWSGISVHLHAAWRGGMMVQAAEILRHTYPGWTEQNTINCENYFLNVIYPQFRLPDPVRAANQGANNIWGAVQVAVFCNDEQKFQDCLEAYLDDPCGGISNSLPNGQCGDTGRDQGHAGAMIGNLGASAQIFFNQGIDVYGVLDNRLLKIMEYWCQYNSGEEVEFIHHGTCYGYYTSVGDIGRDPVAPHFTSVMEGVRANYVVRLGLEAPHTLAFIDRVPTQIDTFFNRKDSFFTDTATPSREPNPPFEFQKDLTSLTDTEIGNPNQEGDSDFSNGTWTVSGSGNGLNERTISYHYAYTQMIGDGEMIARVRSIENTDPNADAALVIRSSLTDPQASMASISARPEQGTQFSARVFDAADGNGTQTFPLSNLPDGPVWLKLERRGSHVYGFVGPDGVTWTPMQHVIFEDWPENVFVGLAATSHNNSELATAVFSDVQLVTESIQPFEPELVVAASGSNIITPSVSSSDLAQTALLSVSSISNSDLANEADQLVNGLIGNGDRDSGDIGEVRMDQGDRFTINLDTITEPLGYDISQIDSVFGWNTDAGGRSNQGYGVRFDLVDGTSQFIEPGHWAPNDPSTFWTTVSFTEASGGPVASGVASITFEITESAVPGGFVVAREFDIFGSPSGGTAVLLGDCNLDGNVDFLDISSLIELLMSGVYIEQADCNEDGEVNFSDITPFIAILTGS